MHTPERKDGESQQAYKERRAAAKVDAKRITGAHLNGGISSRKQFRDSMRSSGTMGKRVRAYAALMAAWAAKRVTKAKLRDQHGAAYTLVGRDAMPNGVTDGRRMWLAGISAQRGY